METTQRQELHISPPDMIVKAGAAVLGMLAIFLLVLTISTLKQLHYIGSGVAATNTISVDGTGDVFSVPDTATFSYSVTNLAKDVVAAQTKVNNDGNAILAYLKEQGVEEKNIQTTDYSVNPQYDYSNGVCGPAGYCPPGKQVLSGYQVSQTVTVKVKDTNKAGTLLSGIGAKGATNISGLSFTVENETALQAQARSKAIEDARTKANELAKELGVSIVRIVGFSESGRGGPIYYAKAMRMDSAGEGAQSAPSAEIATGQNKITSNVSVTYEIR